MGGFGLRVAQGKTVFVLSYGEILHQPPQEVTAGGEVGWWELKIAGGLNRRRFCFWD
jgi:hypothetical protein